MCSNVKEEAPRLLRRGLSYWLVLSRASIFDPRLVSWLDRLSLAKKAWLTQEKPMQPRYRLASDGRIE